MKKTVRETWKHFELFLSFFPLTFSIFERRGSMPTIIFPSFLIHLSPLSNITKMRQASAQQIERKMCKIVNSGVFCTIFIDFIDFIRVKFNFNNFKIFNLNLYFKYTLTCKILRVNFQF